MKLNGASISMYSPIIISKTCFPTLNSVDCNYS
jgi:hypothetical protein